MNINIWQLTYTINIVSNGRSKVKNNEKVINSTIQVKKLFIQFHPLFWSHGWTQRGCSQKNILGGFEDPWHQSAHLKGCRDGVKETAFIRQRKSILIAGTDKVVLVLAVWHCNLMPVTRNYLISINTFPASVLYYKNIDGIRWTSSM